VAAGALLLTAASPHATAPNLEVVEGVACAPAAAEPVEAPELDGRQKILVEHLSRRYLESRFNPIAESGMGAKGLMQIIPRYHFDKLHAAGGEDAVFDPESNIQVGSRILQEYVRRFGTLEAGLQYYNGAWRDPSAQYAQKVIAERDRLEKVVRERGLRAIAAADPRS